MADRCRVQIAQPIVGAAEWEAVRAPIEAGWLAQGPLVAEFESRFAARHEVGAAVARRPRPQAADDIRSFRHTLCRRSVTFLIAGECATCSVANPLLGCTDKADPDYVGRQFHAMGDL